MNKNNITFPSIQECCYTSHYCEENIWKLCDLIRQRYSDSLESCYCIFVSNENKQTPLWNQKAGTGSKYFVVWDYHVFLVVNNKSNVFVFDFDTTLGFPVTFLEYIEKSIGLEVNISPRYHRYFRVIPAVEYLMSLSSDRRHMKSCNGEWLKPPPSYEPIQSNDTNHNLDEFISMEVNQGPGMVLNLEGFIRYFTKH